MYIDVNDISITFGEKDKKSTVLDHVSLRINQGEFICLLGPSGCGKSTLLNAMAGFLTPASGEIKINGELVTKPDSRYLTIFQNYGLFPWRTVEKNVELGLEQKGVPKKERREISKKYIEMVGLSGSEKKHPRQLSGDMQQRVSIARALAMKPEILFMDEPFGALDAITRMKLQDDILNICKELKTTIIFVTHDIEEAVFLADRIIILEPNPGRIKADMHLKMPAKRDRTSDDFVLARDHVFDLMHMKEDLEPEYYL